MQPECIVMTVSYIEKGNTRRKISYSFRAYFFIYLFISTKSCFCLFVCCSHKCVSRFWLLPTLWWTWTRGVESRSPLWLSPIRFFVWFVVFVLFLKKKYTYIGFRGLCSLECRLFVFVPAIQYSRLEHAREVCCFSETGFVYLKILLQRVPQFHGIRDCFQGVWLCQVLFCSERIVRQQGFFFFFFFKKKSLTWLSRTRFRQSPSLKSKQSVSRMVPRILEPRARKKR